MSAAPLKILCVFGTRPEAIKMAPVIRALQACGGRADPRVCVTGQHREMLDQMLALFDIQPDYDLGIMRDDQSLTDVTVGVLRGLEPVLAKETPQWVLVQGDTTTTLGAALAAFYQRIKIGHVEAGLRTRNKLHPFPEEVNRRVVDSLSDLHFAPTETARRNLRHDGVDDASIHVTGNTVIDALRWVTARTAASASLPCDLRPAARLVLVTAHRHENFGPPLEHICRALTTLAEQYGSRVQIVYSVHPNPHVHGPVHRLLGHVGNITLLPPLAYPELVAVMQRAHLVLTDSGGLQEEAPGLGKPVLVLREVTERPEAVEAGTVKVIGTETRRIVAEVTRLLDDGAEYERMARAVNPYGDGHAAERIVRALLEYRASADPSMSS